MILDTKNSIVLDFFAGSGSFAHAVLDQNLKDGGERKFILVSSTEATTDEPEKNLCRDVCRERVANVIKGYGNVPGTGGSFAYLRTHRIAQGRILRKLDHPRVWTFLQLMHFADLSTEPPHASGRLFLRGMDSSLVLYVTDLSEAVLKRLEKETSTASEATIYSWQPEALATRVSSPRITILPIPKTLLERFGSRMGLGSAAAWKDGSP